MEKYLIINADDFGMCHSHNLATIDLFNKGAITSATVMAPCRAAREAADFAIKHPSLSIGVHLTLTSEWKDYRWSSVADNVPSLIDSEGFLYRSSSEFAGNARLEDTKKELMAQMEYLTAMGLDPSHIDNHMGSLYGITNGDFRFLELFMEIAEQYKLPMRFPCRLTENMFSNGTLDIKIPKDVVVSLISKFAGMTKNKNILTPDYLVPGDWKGEQDRSYENYREYIYELYRTFDHGITETYIHPALECDEIKSITAFWHRRVWEHRLFSDPKTADHIKSLGIKLISYRELEKIREKA